MPKENLPKKLQSIKKFASWSGYLKNIFNAIRKRVLSKKILANDVISNEEKDKTTTVIVNIDYRREKGEFLLKLCYKKLGRSINQKVILLVDTLSQKYRFSQIWNISSTS